MGRHSPAGEARWCSRRSGRGWRHRGPGSRSRDDDAGRTAASSVARARGRYALKRRDWLGFRSKTARFRWHLQKLDLLSRQTIVDKETDDRLEQLIREFGQLTR